MKIGFAVPLALGLLISLPGFAQRPEERGQQLGEDRHENVHANQGRIPQAAPPKRDNHAKPEIESTQVAASTAYPM